MESRRLESRPEAAARWVLVVFVRVGEPIFSRPVGWRRFKSL